MTRLETELHLPDATPAEVAALWWDTDRWPSFVDGFSHVHKREDGWPAEGGRLLWEARPASERGRVAERVTSRDADGGAEVRLEDARLFGTQTVRFAPTGSGTLVTLRLDYTHKAPGRFIADLVYVRRHVRREMSRTLERLAREIAMERELAGEEPATTRTPPPAGA
jgi:hypothetical protein